MWCLCNAKQHCNSNVFMSLNMGAMDNPLSHNATMFLRSPSFIFYVINCGIFHVATFMILVVVLLLW